MIIKLQSGDKFKVESDEKREARRKYKEHSLLSMSLKLKRNLNIASNFLKLSPNITNFGNAISALFGGYSPENPDLHYGEAPGVGIKNFGNLVRTARVAREFNDVVKGPVNLFRLLNNFIEKFVTNPKGSGKLIHYDKGNGKSIFQENRGASIINGKLIPGKTKRKGLKDYTWWNTDNPYMNVHKAKEGPFSPTRYIVVDDNSLFQHPFNLKEPVGQSAGKGRGFITKTERVTDKPVDLTNAEIYEKSPFGWWERVKVLPKVKEPPEVNDSKQNVYIPDRLGWKELTYPAYINHVWSRLKAKGIKTEPFDRSNTNQETLMNFFNKGFNPVFKLYPQANLKAHAQEILRRMKNFGLDVDNTMGELPLYGKKSIKDLVTLNSGRTSYIGYYNKPGVTGTFFHNNGTSIVDPGYPQDDVNPLQSIASTMHHERNMHGTLRFLTPEMWKLYEDFLKKIFPETTTDKFGRTVVRTHDDLTVPIGSGSVKKEELRATIGEMIRNIYNTRAYNKAQLARAAEGGPDIKKYDLEIIRPYFEKAVDEMSDKQLNYMLSKINGYGEDYAMIGPRENPDFYKELRNLLKVAPATIPFLIPRKEEKK